MKDFETEQVSAGELFKFFWDHFLAFFGILKSKDSNNMGKNTLPTVSTFTSTHSPLLYNLWPYLFTYADKCMGTCIFLISNVTLTTFSNLVVVCNIKNQTG